MNNLRKIREAKGWTQKELANALSISQSSISDWENDKAPIDSQKLLIISKIFSVSVDEVLGNKIKNVYPITTKKFPVLGEVAAGVPIVMNEEFEVYIEAGTGIHADFCIKVKGNSMINARIHDGDIVFIRQQPTIDNGEIACVAIEDEAVLKRIYKYPDQIVLYSENPKYAPIIVTKNDNKEVRILGKAIAFQSVVK